jgi:hypothetical protein
MENNDQIVPKRFAMGISLQQLDIVTTDENWEVKFIKKNERDISMRKRITIRNLDVYWIYDKPVKN